MNRHRLLVAGATVALVAVMGLGSAPAMASPNVLLVGPAGTAGAQYSSVQDAVNAASPGDWILVAPGVYHEKGSPQAGVLIQKPNIHLRGMNRNGVIVDGTTVSPTQTTGTLPAGSPACSSADNMQDLGVKNGNGFLGYNGIEVKGFTGSVATHNLVNGLADGVSIENLSVCNYLTGAGNGNEIWWNGGDGQGQIGMHAFSGDYISTTSTYFKTADGPGGQYGIFTSNVGGPGVIDHSYANNMRDSAYYIGACRNCNTVLTHAHAENSALGLSSTNSGGNLIIRDSEWDLNRTGLVSNAQNNDDFPSPEYGQCVAPSTPPTLGGFHAGPNSCYVIFNNYIHDNNNPNTPGSGLTAVSAIGTGIELVATQHISVLGNHIYNQGAWGVVTHDFPDPESGPAKCHGGVDLNLPAVGEICYWFSLGNYVAHNQFSHNGYFGNLTNGDIANQAPGLLKAPSDSVGKAPDPNCFSSNKLTSPTSEWPPLLQEIPCLPLTSSEPAVLTAQLLCATGALSLFTQGVANAPACPVGASYPQHDAKCAPPAVLTPNNSTGVCFLPLSRTLDPQVNPTMPDPCNGTPANAYCPEGQSRFGTLAVGIAGVNGSNTLLPNTSAGRGPLAPVGAIGIALAAAAGWRRRRARRA